eukprot:90782_1
MACVAHALVVTCLAKNKSSGHSSGPRGLRLIPFPSSSLSLLDDDDDSPAPAPDEDCHLKRKDETMDLAITANEGLEGIIVNRPQFCQLCILHSEGFNEGGEDTGI